MGEMPLTTNRMGYVAQHNVVQRQMQYANRAVDVAAAAELSRNCVFDSAGL